jgi:hypothetical protein
LRPLRAQQCITTHAPLLLAPCLPPSEARPATLPCAYSCPPLPGCKVWPPHLCPWPEARSLLSGPPWSSAALSCRRGAAHSWRSPRAAVMSLATPTRRVPGCRSNCCRAFRRPPRPALQSLLACPVFSKFLRPARQLPCSAPASGVQMSTAQLSQPRDGRTAACPAPASTAVPGMAAARTPSSGGPVGVLDPAPVDGSGPLQVAQSVPSRSTPYTSPTWSPLRPQLAVPAPLRASCSLRRLSRGSNPAV